MYLKCCSFFVAFNWLNIIENDLRELIYLILNYLQFNSQGKNTF